MKILIKESQRNKLVKLYIDSELKDLVKREWQTENSHESFWFKPTSGKGMINLDNVLGYLYFNYTFVHDIENIFSLEESEVLELLEQWCYKHLGISPVDLSSPDIINTTLRDLDSGNF